MSRIACWAGGARVESMGRRKVCARRISHWLSVAWAGWRAWLRRSSDAISRARREPERHLRAADLVVTGEGAIDRSTLMGKGVGQIAQRCRKLNIPCIGLAGTLSASPRTGTLFTQAHALTELTSVAQAKAKPAHWLERLARRVANTMSRLHTLPKTR